MKDVAFRRCPSTGKKSCPWSRRSGLPLLLGVRGEEKKDLDSVVDTIVRWEPFCSDANASRH